MHLPRYLFAVLALSLAPETLAQVPNLEVIARTEVGPSSPGQLRRFLTIFPGAETGWVAETWLATATPSFESVLFGQLVSGDAAGPRVLRGPMTIGGIVQERLSDPSLADGQLAYLSAVSLGGTRSAWVEDTLVAEEGTPAGTSGADWDQLRSIEMATDGSAAVWGKTDAAGPSELVLEWPSGQVLLQSGDAIPGTPETVGAIRSVDRSADGQSVVASVELLPSQRAAILVDGELYTYGSSYLAVEGELATPALLNGPAGAVWGDLRFAVTNNAGDVVFRAHYSNGVSSGVTAVRNGLEMYEDPPLGGSHVGTLEPTFLSERGMVTWGGIFVRYPWVALENEPLHHVGSGVDVDGDGAVDVGYNLHPLSFGRPTAAMNGSGGLFGVARLSAPAGSGIPDSEVIVRTRMVQEASTVCLGEVNGTGTAAKLVSVGSDAPAFNDMKLLAIGLPGNTFAVPLFSRSTSAGVTPPGSAGTLCLGGAIGRGNFSVLHSGGNGASSVRIYLNVMPQPTGTVQVLPGETWYAQLWYRDILAGNVSSNFSDAIAIKFR